MLDESQRRLWLFRPKPLDDELLSSWLVRCAYANLRKLHAFCSQVWGARHHFWERDVDRSGDIRLLTALAECTNTPNNRAYMTTLAAYEGILFEYFNRNGELPWVMPVVKRGRHRLGYGMQFCPQCLATDETPYYRRLWRLSCAVICPVHSCYLHDCCPECGAPVTFHQGDYGMKFLPFVSAIRKCKRCGLDRGAAPVMACCENGEREIRLLAFQRRIADALSTGWAREPGAPAMRHIKSIAYFSGLHDLIRALCSKSRTGRLREGCARALGMDFTDEAPELAGTFDAFRLKKRQVILELAAWLLESWPERLVTLANEYGVASSYFIFYKKQTVYWYQSPLKLYLDASHYHPSEREIDSCRSFLKASGLLISKNNLQRWLGRYYVDKRRYVKSANF